MEKTLFLLCGIARSGKSTYVGKIREMYGANIPVVSRDIEREFTFGDKGYMEEECLITKICENKMDILSNNHFIVDNTNLSFKRRVEFYEFAKKNGFKVKVFVIMASPQTLFDRATATGFPCYVIKNMLINCDFYKMEYVDKIHYPNIEIEYVIEDINRHSLLQQCKGFNQDNPHHTHDLYNHMYNSADVVSKYYTYFNDAYNEEMVNCNLEYSLLDTVAIYHDIGKLYTKEYVPELGYSRYFGHDNVSSYLSFMFFFDKDYRDIVTYLIGFHMRRFQDKIGKKQVVEIKNFYNKIFKPFNEKQSSHNKLDLPKMIEYTFLADVQSHGDYTEEAIKQIEVFIEDLKERVVF